MNLKHIAKAAVAAAFLVAVALPVRADNLVIAWTSEDQILPGPTTRILNIHGSAVDILNFLVPVSGKVSVTYTAVCRLRALPSSNYHIEITVLIDDQPVEPSGPGDTFCSGGWAEADGAVVPAGASRSITVSPSLLAGTHSIRIVAHNNGNSEDSFLGSL